MEGLAYKSVADITSAQWFHVHNQVAYALGHSAYYRAMAARFDIQIKALKTFEDFRNIPITTKDDLSKLNIEFLAISEDAIIDYVTTSGTLGKPISFGLNEFDLQRLALNEKQSFRIAGLTAKDRVQITTTLDRRFMAGMAYFLGLRNLGAGAIRVGSGLPALQWESIHRFQPTAIIGVPSFILKLAEYAVEYQIDLKDTSIKKAICIGEPLRNQDNLPNRLHNRITQLWDIELFSTYASTEMSTAFTECEYHNGNHEQSELIYTEVLDANGNLVKVGEVGELVVTPLGTQSLPLLRFATGDMVRQLSGTCKCGRHSKRYSPVIGRNKQLLKVKGTSFYPQQCFEVLDALEYLKIYVVKAKTSQAGLDEISILLPDHLMALQRQDIKEKLQANLRITPVLEGLSEQELESLKFSKGQRKPVRFLDLR